MLSSRSGKPRKPLARKAPLTAKSSLDGAGSGLNRKTPLRPGNKNGLSQNKPLANKTSLGRTHATIKKPPVPFPTPEEQRRRAERKEAEKREKERLKAALGKENATPSKKVVRHVDEAHLAFIRTLPCLICGRPSEAHHLLRTPERGIGRKSDDRHTVPLCDPHHDGLHADGNETRYLADHRVKDALGLSERLYELTGKDAAARAAIENWLAPQADEEA